MIDFKNTYDRKIFLDFLQNQLLPDDFEINETPLHFDRKPQKISKITRLGFVKSLGKDFSNPLKVYEINHDSENDPRVSLTKEAFSLLSDDHSSRSLVIFKSSNSDNYRFSLMTVDLVGEGKQVKKESSNPRRYSYYLGPEAKVHTPSSQLVTKGKARDFEDLISRFSVEVISSEFFTKYRTLFEKLTIHLESDNAFKVFALKNNISISDFSKKLLGQIVFLYFIQKKGWLGAKEKEAIYKGDKDFLRNLFNKSIRTKNNFFNDYLEHLFYAALNKKPDRAGSFYRNFFECQIPFLNGGLFEPLSNYNWAKEIINIPNEMFSSRPEDPKNGNGILDIFDLYNFTVAEDDPIDKEVSIDPEMLGMVFENLLEENLRKGTGTYYTPREIVHYMCQESLANYLATETNTNIDDIHHLVAGTVFNNNSLPGRLKKKASLLDQALMNIKVVDPACGSGAFCVGMLQEIVKARLLITPDTPEYKIKKEVIQNSIYGVDIDAGAVDIAKLRLWLSLVVDYELEEIEPLPNLDYKIMQGNSLIELLSPELLSGTTDLEKQKVINKLRKLKEEVFSTSDSIKKKEIKEQINTLIHTLANYERQKEKNDVWRKILANRNQNPLFEEEHAQKTFADVETKLIKKIEKLDQIEDFSARGHFEWHLNYFEIFERDGFDVVIANPPYLRVDDIAKDERDRFKKTYVTSSGKYDLYYLFFEKALSLCKTSGSCVFISPNKFCAASSAEKLRNLIFSSIESGTILSTSMLKVFDSASNYPIISILRRHSPDKGTFFVRQAHDLSDLLKETENSYQTSVDEFSLLPGKVIPINVSQAKLDFILEKLFVESVFLSELLSISEGLRIPKKLESDVKHNNNEIVKQYQFSRYAPVEEGAFLSKENFKNVISEKSDRYKKIMQDKILIAEDALKISSTLDTKKRIPQGGVYFAVSINQEIDLKFMLGLLNSKLLSFVYEVLFAGMHMGGGYLRYRSKFLECLPYPKTALSITTTKQKSIVKNVDKLLEAVGTDNEEQIQAIEHDIDQIVYKLYGLTEEEIALVEQ